MSILSNITEAGIPGLPPGETMAEYPAAPRRRKPTHPGRVVASSLKSLGVTVNRAAGEMGISAQALGNVVSEVSRVSPAMALRLGTYLGNGPEVWLRLQAELDLWETRAEMKADLKRIKPAQAA